MHPRGGEGGSGWARDSAAIEDGLKSKCDQISDLLKIFSTDNNAVVPCPWQKLNIFIIGFTRAHANPC